MNPAKRLSLIDLLVQGQTWAEKVQNSHNISIQKGMLYTYVKGSAMVMGCAYRVGPWMVWESTGSLSCLMSWRSLLHSNLRMMMWGGGYTYAYSHYVHVVPSL